MTGKKTIEDIRRIAKTNEILKRIPNTTQDKDKGSILSRRGVGYAGELTFNPCQYLYNSDDGSYNMADLIDGVDGPKVSDESSCDVINTITGCREIGETPTLAMVLKPDGIFTDTATGAILYTSNLIMDRWISNPEEFDSATKWGFLTPEAATTKTFELFDAVWNTSLFDWVGEVTTPEPYTLTSGNIGITNYSTSYPVYSIVMSGSGKERDEDTWLNTCTIGVYSNLDDFPDPSLDGGGSIPTYNTIETANTINLISPINPSDIPIDLHYPGYWMYYRLGEPLGGCSAPFYFKATNSDVDVIYHSTIFSIPSDYDATLDPESLDIDPPIVYGPLVDIVTGDFSQMVLYTPEEMPDFNNGFQLALLSDDYLWHTDGENPLNPVKYTNGVSIVDFEFGDGYTRTGRVHPAKNGGFAIYETSAGNPIGSAYIFRHNRTLEIVINYTQLTPYLA